MTSVPPADTAAASRLVARWSTTWAAIRADIPGPEVVIVVVSGVILVANGSTSGTFQAGR